MLIMCAVSNKCWIGLDWNNDEDIIEDTHFHNLTGKAQNDKQKI